MGGTIDLADIIINDPEQGVEIIGTLLNDPSLIVEGIRAPFDERLAAGDTLGAISYGVGALAAAIASAPTRGVAPNTVGADITTVTSRGQANAATGAQLNRQLTLDEIVDHSFDKHVITQNEFSGLGIRTREQFRSHVDNVINNPTERRFASDGRIFHLDSNTQTIVITNPRGSSTAFRPSNWQNYISTDKIPKRSVPPKQ